MILDLDDLGRSESFEADVCVVGAGAAGITLARRLTESGSALSLTVIAGSTEAAGPEATPLARVRQALHEIGQPAPVSRIRQHCGMRTASVCDALAELARQGFVAQDIHGYRLTPPRAA